ncbi:30S ribosomal protein S20 [Candidatus Campbellbacteria bacterium CG22_combo_CG10-13_8_21_14_all_36_13]|uniref:Small ribosomal subunit protein bS20 n=1 Tax=Candidatus Campbellbacteria bacterium CG22_combo_CG10-13_8_21_14_all_36_13 TaxID=1974529 RepID=A0A2H0DXQ6_9BACT|nr:MAG: 30S ribosomal protein S20 [Candidatus Campbellbacteria bacterium CG22_combo_CG10-13_8_21_14_all_36_13]
MPITRSAKKALRSSANKRIFNLRTKRNLSDTVKTVKKMVFDKKTAEAEKSLSGAYKAIDKAAKRGVIKKNTASRKKSRLTKLVNRNK